MAQRFVYAIVRLPVERTEDIEADRRAALGRWQEVGASVPPWLFALEELPSWFESQCAIDGIAQRQAALHERCDRRRSLLGAMSAAGVERLASLIGPKPKTLEELGQRTVEGLAGAGMLLVANELANLGVFQEALRQFAGNGRDRETLPAPDAPTKPPPRRGRPKAKQRKNER